MLRQLGFKTLTALSVPALGTVMIAPATVRSDELPELKLDTDDSPRPGRVRSVRG